MLNIITNELPSTISVDGSTIPINTDFRVSLQAARLLDDPVLPDMLKIRGIVAHYTKDPCFIIDDNTVALYKACVAFLNAEALVPPAKSKRRPRQSIRSFSWDVDQQFVVADFQREYALDLTDRTLSMHWWRFLALFNGLGDTSKTMTVRGIRIMKVPKGASPEEARKINESKRALELPPRSRAEARMREDAKWGE